jgi:hypothetical protein
VNETDNFSDLDPYASPRWLVEVKFDGSRKMLYSTMDELIDLRETSDSEYKVTHYAHTHRSDGSDMASALSMITQSNATDTTSISFVNATSPAEHIVRQLIKTNYFLF